MILQSFRRGSLSLLGDRKGSATLELVVLALASAVSANQVAALVGQSLQTAFAPVNAALALLGG